MKTTWIRWALLAAIAAPGLAFAEHHEEGEERERREHIEREREEMRRHEKERDMREHRERGEREEHARRENKEREGDGDREIGPEQALQYLRERAPEKFEELMRIRRENPRAFEEHLREVVKHMHQRREMEHRAPELAEAMKKAERLERESHQLAQKLRETRNKEERAPLREKLRDMLNEAFEVRLVEGTFHVKQMRREIEEIQEKIERRRANKERIVERRMNELVGGGDDELAW